MSPSAFDIASSGMAAHRLEMDVIAQNIANAGTRRTREGEPYRERRVVTEPLVSGSFASILDDAAFAPFDDEDEPAGVEVTGIVESNAPAEYRYDPHSPFAFASGARKGFVAEPSVDPIEQMISLVSAGRAYDADVAALQAAKQMDVEAVDVDRS